MILNVKFQQLANIKVEFQSSVQAIETEFENIQQVTEYIGGEVYEGSYEATPKVTAQYMPTKNKLLLKDVTVNAIPFFNVSNLSGGNTVYIGNEVE